MRKILFLGALSAFSANASQFVSLNLCSDRLLLEIADPTQIAAMSPYSRNPRMMLDKLNTDKPTLEPQLLALLPYADKTILMNETFYPLLAGQLKQLGVNIVALNDNPQTPEELFALIAQLGKLTGRQTHAAALIKRLETQYKLQQFSLKQTFNDTVILSETGIVETHTPPYQTLLKLLGLSTKENGLSERNFSLEKLILSSPSQILLLSDQRGYNFQGELLRHPVLQNALPKRPLATVAMKYTYCFDHGVWQGAELIWRAVNP